MSIMAVAVVSLDGFVVFDVAVPVDDCFSRKMSAVASRK